MKDTNCLLTFADFATAITTAVFAFSSSDDCVSPDRDINVSNDMIEFVYCSDEGLGEGSAELSWEGLNDGFGEGFGEGSWELSWEGLNEGLGEGCVKQ